MIKLKDERGEYVNHPDAPDAPEARLYYMFDTTTWTKSTENEHEQSLSGKTSVDAEKAVELAKKMASSALGGPTYAKAPANLKIEVTATAESAGPAKPKPKPRKQPGSEKPKQQKGQELMGYFKMLTKALAEMKSIDTLTEKLADKPDTEPFTKLLNVQKTKITATYEKLRCATAVVPPDFTHLAELKSEMDKLLTSLKVDSQRISRMFLQPASGKAKASAKAAAKAAAGA